MNSRTKMVRKVLIAVLHDLWKQLQNKEFLSNATSSILSKIDECISHSVLVWVRVYVFQGLRLDVLVARYTARLFH